MLRRIFRHLRREKNIVRQEHVRQDDTAYFDCAVKIKIGGCAYLVTCRYLPTYGITDNANPRRDSQQFLRDCGAKAELGMLAVQLGTEETNYERPFTLNLLSNEDEENANEVDAEEKSVKRGASKPKMNKDYKAKLDDLFQDEHEGLKRSMDLLDLLDEVE